MICVDARPQQIQTITTIKGSEAFRLEYSSTTPEKAIYNDVVSYLGEYRFQVQKYQYKLFYTQGTDGLHIRGEEKGRALLEIGKKGIEDRQQRGEITKKVVADYLGMQQMEELLITAQDGDTIMYASPADVEEGYDYGFFYVGQVIQVGNEKRLDMTAIRLDKNQSLDQYNKAINLLTGVDVNFSTVNEFIAHPQILHRTISPLEIDFVMKGVFDFAMDQGKQKDFARIIQSMSSYIQEFIGLVKSGASVAVLEPAFYALENYALELRRQPESILNVPLRRDTSIRDIRIQPNLAGLIHTHGYEPPKATGTCGPTSRKNKLGGADLYGQSSLWEGEINKLINNGLDYETESEGFECPNCGGWIPWGSGDSCPHCSMTKQKWGEEGHEVCA